jgi:hypothetical protein
MARHLAYCQSCSHVYVAETNGFGVVIAYEEIPEDQQPTAHQRRLQKPGSDLCVFGGCLSCGNRGWPSTMEKKPFRGLL